jgi:hypothetical protein
MTGPSLFQRSPSECVCVCVCVCVYVCHRMCQVNNSTLHTQWVGSRVQNKKEKKKERLRYKWHTILCRPFYTTYDEQKTDLLVTGLRVRSNSYKNK